MAKTYRNRKAYFKAYYRANREKVLAQRKAWREANREKTRAYDLARTEAHREKTWCNRAVQSSRQRAHAKGTPHTINSAYLESLWTDTCPVLGVRFNLAKGTGRGPDSASLDCFDPTKGYVPGNVCIISNLANMIKQDVLDPDIIDRVAHYVRNPHLYVPNWSPDG